MADFFYNTLTPLFGAENIRLVYSGKSFLLGGKAVPSLKTYLFSDTDSYYLEFLDSTWWEAVTALKEHIDFSNFPATHEIFESLDYDQYAKQRKAQFGYVDNYLCVYTPFIL